MLLGLGPSDSSSNLDSPIDIFAKRKCQIVVRAADNIFAKCKALGVARGFHLRFATLSLHVILLMKYGNAHLSGKFVLAPMAAYTDIAFRLLCRRAGAAMCFTEFANAEAIVRGGKNTEALMQTCPEEMPVGIQIFGGKPETMARAVERINERFETGELLASCIDINYGCPAGSVVRAGAGSALLRSPEKMREIAAACVKASTLPITAKIRVGWGKDDGIKIAKMLEGEGIAGIAVHWRTATEGRKRSDGWKAVGEIAREVTIPVIGNGGATTPEKAVKFLDEAGCGAVMIASGALGNPGIFSQANALLAGKAAEPDAWNGRRASYFEYAALAGKYGLATPKRLRAHALEFVKGSPGATGARRRLNAVKSAEEIETVLSEFEPPEVK